MVEYNFQLNLLFHSLSDPIRRDILIRVSKRELSVGELVSKYDISFAAISKHLKVLEKAMLISKRKEGKKQMVSVAPAALVQADAYLEQYRHMWDSRFAKLDKILREGE